MPKIATMAAAVGMNLNFGDCMRALFRGLQRILARPAALKSKWLLVLDLQCTTCILRRCIGGGCWQVSYYNSHAYHSISASMPSDRRSPRRKLSRDLI